MSTVGALASRGRPAFVRRPRSARRPEPGTSIRWTDSTAPSASADLRRAPRAFATAPAHRRSSATRSAAVTGSLVEQQRAPVARASSRGRSGPGQPDAEAAWPSSVSSACAARIADASSPR